MYPTEPTNPADARSRAFGVAIVGVLIILAGAVLLGGNLGLIDSRYVFRNFGPLVIFVLGVAMLMRRRHDQVLLGLILMFVGAWGFATQQQWIKIHFWAVIGPLMLVLAGGSVVWRAFNRPVPQGAGDAYIRTFAVFSGAELRPTVPFQGAERHRGNGRRQTGLVKCPHGGRYRSRRRIHPDGRCRNLCTARLGCDCESHFPHGWLFGQASPLDVACDQAPDHPGNGRDGWR